MEKITVQQAHETKQVSQQVSHEHTHVPEHNHEHTKEEEKHEHKKDEVKVADNKTEVKPEKKSVVQSVKKKDEAVARGMDLPLSKKHCMYISSFIKNKPIDVAIKDLEDVVKFKRAVPFKGEIPHRSEPGMMSGRYPITAAARIIILLKGLKGNVIANGMDLEKTRIAVATASWASRPQHKGGSRFKRTHVTLIAKEFEPKSKSNEHKGDKK